MCKKLLITVILIMIVFVSAGSVAYASDDDLYKNLDETAQQSGDDYFVKYRDNYSIDTEEMSFFKDPGSVVLATFTNLVFSLQLLLSKLVISIFSFAISTNITVMLGSFLEPFINAMQGGMWNGLAIYAIAFGAFVLLLKMAQNRTSQAMSEFIGMILIITMAFIFYAYPMQMMEGIDTITSGISNEVMEGPYKATVGGTASDAKGKASALCWNLFVHKPWQILEFGSVETAKKYEADILKLKPDSEQRGEYVKKLAESEGIFSKFSAYQGERLGMSLLFFLFTLVLMVVILVFTALIIGFQFLLIVYFMMGIFVFIAALLPAFGLNLIKRWGMRIISVSFTRVMVVFFLSVTLVMMDVIYGFADTYGLFVTVWILIIIIGSMWYERYRLLDLFASYQANSNQLPQSINKPLDTEFNSVDKLISVRRTAMYNLESMKQDIKGEFDKTKTSKTRTSKYQDQSGRRNQGDNPNANVQANTFNCSGTTNDSTLKSAETLRSAALDMSEYFKHAEALLQKQYEYSKTKSEEEAIKKKEQPEYDDFVKRTDKLRKKGVGNFDNRDVSNVANIMRRTVEQGGSVYDVVSNGKTIYRDKQRLERPQSLSTVSDNSKHEASRNTRQVNVPKGIEYFKSNFGEEQGEEIYENLVEKYGKDKLKMYRPFYNNNGKQSYAQVVKQLNENIDTNKLSKSKKTQKSTKLRSGGGRKRGQ
ncbi:MAG: CD3337/EF1877 family mobilome membrane protein [Aminipila sp.]